MTASRILRLPRCGALLFVLVALATEANGFGFWNSRFDTSEHSRFLYQNHYMLTIFKHVTESNSFYFTPLMMLDYNSGLVTHNPLTQHYELRLRVIMWSNQLKESVKTFLTQQKGVRNPSVRVLPMEKIRFTWRSRQRIQSSLILDEEFMSVHHLPSKITLTFASGNRTSMVQLNKRIRDNPEILDKLELDCFMTAKKSAMKKITVTIEHLMKSGIFAKMTSLPPDGNYRYMRADDFNNLAQEAFSSVRATTIRSTEYIDKADEFNIVGLIERALKQDNVISSSLSEGQWESVFWDPIYARPDKVTKMLNKTFTKDASDNKYKVNKEFLKDNEQARKLLEKKAISGAASVGGYGYSVSAEGSSSSEQQSESSERALRSGKMSSEQLKNLLRERQLSVEFNGEKFQPKSMRLVRINKRSFESRRRIVSDSMQLTLYQQTISLKLRIPVSINDTLEEPWAGSDSADSSGKTGITISSHSHCLLSNGGTCPPGYKRSGGNMIGINIDPENPRSVKKAELGDSSIRCHSPDDSNDCSYTAWEPFKAELRLYVCCI